ncbi:MAG TPA: putative DNA binding domain-containing protein, partial [Pseudomonadota bacterium]|nr:putative DNA binding domain-containing protein [Pseudomonadota bacterium]
MADVTLTDLLLGESPRIEWKQSVDAVDIIHAVCALANDLEDSQQPGYVVLGVDKLGKIVGATDKRKAPLPLFGPAMDEQQQALTSRILSLKLLPHPSLTISAHEAEGKTLLVIAVEPYPVPPEVRVDGVAYVRVGTTTRRATEADLLKLRERRPLHRQPFDVRPMPGAQLSDLTLIDLSPRYESDREEADDPETFPSLEKWLSQKNLGRIVDGRLKPNAAALLVYGKNPQDFFPGAVIELARYAGTEVDAPVT